jgi:hypothetical protein
LVDWVEQGLVELAAALPSAEPELELAEPELAGALESLRAASL